MKIPQRPPPDNQVYAALAQNPSAIQHVPGGYLHWDELRRRIASKAQLDAVWGALRLSRSQAARLPLRATDGQPFSYRLPAELSRLLHQTDVRAGFAIDDPELVNPEQRDRYYVSSIIEEAISSSQLEGAVTTTRVATEMLRSGRRPRDKSEQMVVNNYRAMGLIKQLKNEPLTPELVFRIHREVSHDTLDDPTSSGRFRRPDEEIVVRDEQGTIFHRPPPAAELARRLDAMCAFANEDRGETFVHPIVRAMLLHFWLAYDHPFVDGNGRTARALFYWAGLRHGYWMLEFISISRVLLRSRGDYYRAFLHAETDNNDATYFLLHHAHVIDTAVSDLREWIAKKSKETKRFENRIKALETFNHRQRALLIYALKHPTADLTIRRHQTDHAVVYETARADLLALEKQKLLVRSRRGKKFVFKPATDLESTLNSQFGSDW